MITVVGFNTAIDRDIRLDALEPGRVQRATSASARLGGKGLHVAETVAALGEPVRLIGLTDAAHADELRQRLDARGIEGRLVDATRPLRQCLAIHEADGRVTEILEAGEPLEPAVGTALLTAARDAGGDSRVLVFSGSLPRGLAPDAYAELIRATGARGTRCLLDASGAALRSGIAAKPWLVKPNADEASALFGRPVRGLDEAVACARQLHRGGVSCAVVTLGALGAVGFDGETAWRASATPPEVRNGVGSGDCFLAGLAVATARAEPLEAALRLAAACGAANAESVDAGNAPADRIAAWVPRVTVGALPDSAGAAPRR